MIIKNDILKPENIGSQTFKKDYNVRLAYVVGGMYYGISSKELVIKMGKAKLLSFFGAGGLSLIEIEKNIIAIKAKLNNREPFGINFLHQISNAKREWALVDLLLKYKINNIEASAFMRVTKALVYYRIKGLVKNATGIIGITHFIIAKISRIEVAKVFMEPPPRPLVEELLEEGLISIEQSNYAKNIPMCDDICIEADSGGHTDGGHGIILLPTFQKIKNEVENKYKYAKSLRLGLAGGIGTPQAASSAFFLKADFILTGSINQCTVEANTIPEVKDMLQSMSIHDTAMAPAGDMFELGSKVQVLKKGSLFSARASKLYTLYLAYHSISDLPEKTLKHIEKYIFKKSIAEVYQEVKYYYQTTKTLEEFNALEKNERSRMAAIFKWYFNSSNPLENLNKESLKVDYQIHTSPALGAFNLWVKGTSLDSWKKRYVVDIAEKIMQETALLLSTK